MRKATTTSWTGGKGSSRQKLARSWSRILDPCVFEAGIVEECASCRAGGQVYVARKHERDGGWRPGEFDGDSARNSKTFCINTAAAGGVGRWRCRAPGEIPAGHRHSQDAGGDGAVKRSALRQRLDLTNLRDVHREMAPRASRGDRGRDPQRQLRAKRLEGNTGAVLRAGAWWARASSTCGRSRSLASLGTSPAHHRVRLQRRRVLPVAGVMVEPPGASRRRS